MDMSHGNALRKILLAVLLGGSILTVSACAKAAPAEGAGQKEEAQMKQGQTEQGQAEQGQKEWEQAEQARTEPGQTEAEQTGQTENVVNLPKEEFEELPVVYSLDNSTRIMESRSGVFTGDWDNDGAEDTLNIETMEQEGSDGIRKLELALSGCSDTFVIENADCDFMDIVSGNFDADREAEILLLFDMKSTGANGCCGLQLLDKAGSEYRNIVDGFFTGFDYTAEVQTREESGYRIVNDKSGKSYFLEKENVWESDIAEVTGWYCLEILRGKEQEYIRLKQYVAGGDMTDHVGDMVTILSAEDGRLVVLDEKCVGRTSGPE